MYGTKTGLFTLSSQKPDKTWYDFENSDGKIKSELKGNTPTAIVKQIQKNQEIMDQLGASGTPAIYYLNKEKKLQQNLGLPTPEQLNDLVTCK